MTNVCLFCVLQEAATIRQRHAALRAHPFFQMDVILKEGRDLVVRDSCGRSRSCANWI